jgi:GNAT superfamily N-acetyltransferase
MSISTVLVRKGEQKDIPAILELIKELALYENSPESVKMTEDELLKHGFGTHPEFEFLVAEVDGSVQGMAFYYYCFSTWRGRYLYLEDLIVRQSFRRLGLGSKLFEATIETAKSQTCRQMGWQVLDWNEPAINFYKKYEAKLDGEWINGRFYFE